MGWIVSFASSTIENDENANFRDNEETDDGGADYG